MDKSPPGTFQTVLCICLAFILWYLIFCANIVNFWFGMSIAAIVLSFAAFTLNGLNLRKNEITLENFLKGAAAAAALYVIFWGGNAIAQNVFPFAKPEISSIYDIRTQSHPFLIAIILLFITSPGEEFFWRGFLQRWIMSKLDPCKGWLLASFIYGAVHVVTGNIMLVLAALIAGLFWGWLFWRTNSLFACMISHAFWTLAIFVFFPVL